MIDDFAISPLYWLYQNNDIDGNLTRPTPHPSTYSTAHLPCHPAEGAAKLHE
jgi:hypothetical protein